MQPSSGQAGLEQPARYEIRVQGELDESWSEWFGGLDIRREDGTTVLSGVVVDQAALRGILTRLWDLRLVLLSVARSDEGLARKGGIP